LTPLRLLCNGYVSAGSGSIASAIHLTVEELLRRGHHVWLVSKRNYVYPDDLVRHFPNFHYCDAYNAVSDRLYEIVGRKLGAAGLPLGMLNHSMFARKVIATMRQLAQTTRPGFDGVLFLGLPAFGRVQPGIRTVSWVQGAPGSDVRSLANHKQLLRSTENPLRLTLLNLFGQYKMQFGLPHYAASDNLLVGSRHSKSSLAAIARLPDAAILAVAYPMNLSLFSVREPPNSHTGEPTDPLRVLWLGRIVPRKRLDLLLDGARRAIDGGTSLKLKIVGRFGFAPGLQKLLTQFPHPQCLEYVPRVEREDVPALLRSVDVLSQPSEDEDFGSSIAEALACGTPVIAGHTNGTADYICPKSFHLPDDRPESLAAVFAECWKRKQEGTLIDPALTRATAEHHFDVKHAADTIEQLFANNR
jgi:glycosyltransferase involved in cell wall biosynthesis